MAPNPKVAAAYRAMTVLGIDEFKVKPVLKKLLKLYDKNWELIEEENYRALADAIFEEQENEVQKKRKKNKNIDEGEMEDEDAQMQDEPVRPLKRFRLRGQESQASHSLTICGPSSASSPSKRPKIEDETFPESCSRQQPQYMAMPSKSDGNARTEICPVPPRDGTIDKGKQPISPQVALRGRRVISERSPPAVPFKEPTAEPGILSLPKNKTPHIHALIKPKDEPVDDLPDYEVPIAVIPPEEPPNRRDFLMRNDATLKYDGHGTSDEVRGEDLCDSSNEVNHEVATVQQECSSNIEIASSSQGEEGSEMVTPRPSLNNVRKESKACDAVSLGGNIEDLGMHSCISNGSINVQSSAALVASHIPISSPCPSGMDDAVLVAKMVRANEFPESDGRKRLEQPKSPNSGSLVVVTQHQLTPEDLRSLHGVIDLTKGEESVLIPWVNETTNDFPSPFNYTPRSYVFGDAYVNMFLSHIGYEDCCSTCLGNCLLSSTPCACANKSGGGYAYTPEGLVKEEFLEECITISHYPQQRQFYCKDCPLERAKNGDCLEPCKGHLKRKFIKECWVKCGCVKQCGNRVVQRGITCKLQVFLTSEGKGWGLRTLEELPKGAFVCEFIGEILTIKELLERNLQCTKNGKYTYPILLDADWDSGVVKDKEALCLDAASYGNVARFINHRCLDANLIEIPVEVETPDHHYYHLAFFTSRKIVAQEELTWDYGIDFDDPEHPIKPFCCRCGSKFCRNMKRSSRSIRSASMAR